MSQQKKLKCLASLDAEEAKKLYTLSNRRDVTGRAKQCELHGGGQKTLRFVAAVDEIKSPLQML